jgi:hypothetical protein
MNNKPDELTLNGLRFVMTCIEYHEAVRNDAPFGKNYLQGKYGAIPFIGEIALQLIPEEA